MSNHSLTGTIYVDGLPGPPKRMRKGSGAPKICWVCGRHLQWAAGKGQGLVYFNLVVDRDGVGHRVHGDCTRSALEDGCKIAPEVAIDSKIKEAMR